MMIAINRNAPKPAAPVGDDAKPLPPLYGPHGSGLIHRLGGAQRMLDAGKPPSGWVAAQIDNEAIAVLTSQAARIAELERENERLRAS